jgi:hypothetical protein
MSPGSVLTFLLAGDCRATLEINSIQLDSALITNSTPRKHRSLVDGPRGNTASSRSPIIAWRHRERDVPLFCVLTGRYLATVLNVTLLLRPKIDEVTGGWRKLRNEELHNLYSSRSIIRWIKWRRMRWAENAARIGEKRNAYRTLVGKPEGKRSLQRTRRM